MRFLLAAMLASALPAAAAETPFLVPAQVDLLRLLPPPPTPGSAEQQAEMAEILALQASRTPERTAQAVADVGETVFDMFTPTLGPAFTEAALPVATRLFARLGATESDLLRPAKAGFARLRPYLANPQVHPAARRSHSGSYPSGHATRSTLDGIVLAAMLPEHRAAIFARVRDYIESRVIAGVHFRSDVRAGGRAGTAIAAVLFNDPAFQAAFGPARQEIRALLGLPP